MNHEEQIAKLKSEIEHQENLIKEYDESVENESIVEFINRFIPISTFQTLLKVSNLRFQDIKFYHYYDNTLHTIQKTIILSVFVISDMDNNNFTLTINSHNIMYHPYISEITISMGETTKNGQHVLDYIGVVYNLTKILDQKNCDIIDWMIKTVDNWKESRHNLEIDLEKMRKELETIEKNVSDIKTNNIFEKYAVPGKVIAFGEHWGSYKMIGRKYNNRPENYAKMIIIDKVSNSGSVYVRYIPDRRFVKKYYPLNDVEVYKTRRLSRDEFVDLIHLCVEKEYITREKKKIRNLFILQFILRISLILYLISIK